LGNENEALAEQVQLRGKLNTIRSRVGGGRIGQFVSNKEDEIVKRIATLRDSAMGVKYF
jgi:hypothetical protein